MPLHPDPRFNGFFLLTGISFVGFAVSFWPCFFNINSVDQCVAVSDHWLGILQAVGDHIIAWAFALFHAAFNQD